MKPELYNALEEPVRRPVQPAQVPAVATRQDSTGSDEPEQTGSQFMDERSSNMDAKYPREINKTGVIISLLTVVVVMVVMLALVMR
jgi:hypothetical protein